MSNIKSILYSSGYFPSWDYIHCFIHDRHFLKHTEKARCCTHSVCFP